MKSDCGSSAGGFRSDSGVDGRRPAGLLQTADEIERVRARQEAQDDDQEQPAAAELDPRAAHRHPSTVLDVLAAAHVSPAHLEPPGPPDGARRRSSSMRQRIATPQPRVGHRSGSHRGPGPSLQPAGWSSKIAAGPNALMSNSGRPDSATALARSPLFSHLGRLDLARLAGELEEMHFAPSQVIVRQGDRPDGFYVIKQGRAAVLAGDAPVPVLRRPGGRRSRLRRRSRRDPHDARARRGVRRDGAPHRLAAHGDGRGRDGPHGLAALPVPIRDASRSRARHRPEHRALAEPPAGRDEPRDGRPPGVQPSARRPRRSAVSARRAPT